MAKMLHSRRLAPLAIVICLVLPLLIFSPGVRPADATLADYSGGHASSPTCNGALPSGTVIGLAATSDDEGYWVANNHGLVVACGDAELWRSDLSSK